MSKVHHCGISGFGEGASENSGIIWELSWDHLEGKLTLKMARRHWEVEGLRIADGRTMRQARCDEILDLVRQVVVKGELS